MIGKTIAHYQILSELGAGGMGVVYLANDTVLKRRVAVKMLNAKHFSRKNQKHFRLLHEARAVSQINHSNIATVYDYGETEDGQAFIVMEYVDGEPLYNLIALKALTVKRTLEIIGAVTAALSEAHRLGIIHRDIKPSNIIISRRHEVKVLDFGLAKQIEDATLSPNASTELYASETPEGAVVVGTPLYISPEQATGARVDERSDIFSLGSVLYECLTGRSPFYAQSTIEVYARVLRDNPIQPSQLNPEVNTELDRIVLKALAKDANQRYQSAREFGRDLGFSDFKETGQEFSPPTGEPESKVKTGSAHPARTDGRTSTVRQTAPFSLSLDGFRDLWSGISSSQIALASLLLLLTCALGYFAYRSITKRETKDITGSLQFQRLPISGNVKEASISPDGKYVAAVLEDAGGENIQLTELATSSNTRITPSSQKGYRGLTFSPDNNYLYYLEDEIETATLYRVSKLGGNNRKILENVNTGVTFSPDGSRISFVRYYKKDEATQLMTAKQDGSDEHILATRKSPESYTLDGVGGPAWSPLDDVIACLTFERTPQGWLRHIEVVEVKDGSRKRLSKQSWYQIRKISWLANGSGLIVAGTNSVLSPDQLSLLSYPDAEVTRITKDPNEYSTISSTSDSSALLTVKVELPSTIWVMPSNNSDKATALAMSENKGVSGIEWLSDSVLIYVAQGIDGFNIWSENTTDGRTSQLTSSGSSSYQPDVSPDKRYIAFVSNRSGSLNIWRMNADGTNQVQLTNGKYEDMPQIISDGKWVVYHSAQKDGKIWKVPIDGGASIPLVSQEALYPAVSPDGTTLAAFVWDQSSNSKLELGVFSLGQGTPIKSFVLPPTVKISMNKLRWSPDGQGLVFVNNENGVSNLWIQPLDQTTPKPLTHFTESRLLFDFAWSPNSQQLACVRGDTVSHVVLIKGMNLH